MMLCPCCDLAWGDHFNLVFTKGGSC